ncbi:hypothetical protein ACWGNN_30940 [Streptomyces sp. NPDC055817]
MAEPIQNLGGQEDLEDPAAQDPAHAPDGRTVPYRHHVQQLRGIHTASLKAPAHSVPVLADPVFALDQDMNEQRSGVNETPASAAPAEPLPTEPDEERPLEPAALPGTVTTVWSSILSTAFRRLREGR